MLTNSDDELSHQGPWWDSSSSLLVALSPFIFTHIHRYTPTRNQIHTVYKHCLWNIVPQMFAGWRRGFKQLLSVIEASRELQKAE